MKATKECAKKIPKQVQSGAKSVTAKGSEFQVQEKAKVVVEKGTSQAAGEMKNLVNHWTKIAAQVSQATRGKLRQGPQKVQVAYKSNAKSSILHKLLFLFTTLSRKAITSSSLYMKTIWNCPKVELRPPTFLKF